MAHSPHTRRTAKLPVLGVAALVSTLLVAVVLASAAAAQTSTSVAPTTTLPAENPGSTAAGFVFFGVTGTIIIGALILYLRNRRPRVPTQP